MLSISDFDDRSASGMNLQLRMMVANQTVGQDWILTGVVAQKAIEGRGKDVYLVDWKCLTRDPCCLSIYREHGRRLTGDVWKGDQENKI